MKYRPVVIKEPVKITRCLASYYWQGALIDMVIGNRRLSFIHFALAISGTIMETSSATSRNKQINPKEATRKVAKTYAWMEST
jgi:hypothetical protein